MLKNSHLFTPISFRGMTLSNRFMRSATWENLSDNLGFPTTKLTSMIRELAIGECGLIIPGYVYPSKSGKAAVGQTSFESDKHAFAWKPTIDFIHQKTSSKIMFQICDGGVRTTSQLTGDTPRGVSAEGENTREMSSSEIESCIDSFIKAAKRAEMIGADGVQLHAAHGYLISAFLSPALNKRNDRWGGSLENRARFLVETVREIRKVTNPNFVVSVKINGDDYREDGVTPIDTADYIRMNPNVDFWEISCGTGPQSFGIRCNLNKTLMRKKVPKEDHDEFYTNVARLTAGVDYYEGYNYAAARVIKGLVPEAHLAVVGGQRDIKEMEKRLVDVDLISMSRPFLREPHIVGDLRKGKTNEIGCDSCGICTLYRKHGIYCHQIHK